MCWIVRVALAGSRAALLGFGVLVFSALQAAQADTVTIPVVLDLGSDQTVAGSIFFSFSITPTMIDVGDEVHLDITFANSKFLKLISDAAAGSQEQWNVALFAPGCTFDTCFSSMTSSVEFTDVTEGSLLVNPIGPGGQAANDGRITSADGTNLTDSFFTFHDFHLTSTVNSLFVADAGGSSSCFGGTPCSAVDSLTYASGLLSFNAGTIQVGVPEPTTALLLVCGLVTVGLRRRRH